MCFHFRQGGPADTPVPDLGSVGAADDDDDDDFGEDFGDFEAAAAEASAQVTSGPAGDDENDEDFGDFEASFQSG